jgi:hypothetical protein
MPDKATSLSTASPSSMLMCPHLLKQTALFHRDLIFFVGHNANVTRSHRLGFYAASITNPPLQSIHRKTPVQTGTHIPVLLCVAVHALRCCQRRQADQCRIKQASRCHGAGTLNFFPWFAGPSPDSAAPAVSPSDPTTRSVQPPGYVWFLLGSNAELYLARCPQQQA